MKKIFCFCVVLFLFSSAMFLPRLTLGECVECGDVEFVPCVGEGVFAFASNRVLGNGQLVMRDNVVIGEQLEVDLNEMNVSKLLSLLGARVVEKLDLSSCLVINAISKLVPYSYNGKEYNIQIKVSRDKILVSSPKFFN